MAVDSETTLGDPPPGSFRFTIYFCLFVGAFSLGALWAVAQSPALQKFIGLDLLRQYEWPLLVVGLSGASLIVPGVFLTAVALRRAHALGIYDAADELGFVYTREVAPESRLAAEIGRAVTHRYRIHDGLQGTTSGIEISGCAVWIRFHKSRSLTLAVLAIDAQLPRADVIDVTDRCAKPFSSAKRTLRERFRSEFDVAAEPPCDPAERLDEALLAQLLEQSVLFSLRDGAVFVRRKLTTVSWNDRRSTCAAMIALVESAVDLARALRKAPAP